MKYTIFILLFIAVNTTVSTAQHSKIQIVINKDIFVDEEDADLAWMKVAGENISNKISNVFEKVTEDCNDVKEKDIDIEQTAQYYFEQILEGLPTKSSKESSNQETNLGFNYAEFYEKDVDVILLTYIDFTRRTDENSLTLKMALVDKERVLKTVENEFLKLSLFNPANRKESTKINDELEKIMRKLLNFKYLKENYGTFQNINRKCTCTRTKLQRFLLRSPFATVGSFAGGIALSSYGLLSINKANQQYKDYERYDYFYDPFYVNQNITPDKFLQNTRNKNRIGYTALSTGALLTVVGGIGLNIHFGKDDSRTVLFGKDNSNNIYEEWDEKKYTKVKTLRISPLLNYDYSTEQVNSQIRITYNF